MHKITNSIQNVAELQNIIGEPHDIIKAKVLDQLDRHCLAYLKQSQITFLGFWHEGVSDILILSGNLGFIEAVDNLTLRIPYQQEFSIIKTKIFDELLPVSLYFWLPGIEETLRINGVAKWLNDNKSKTDDNPKTLPQDLCIDIKGAFLHCAKSIKRSKLWEEKQYLDRKINFTNNYSELMNNNHKIFIESSPFLCLHTQNNSNQTELSPRGDPSGFVHIIDDGHLLIPDRPGNKRVDSMRNLLGNPLIGVILLIPGSDIVLKINGRASLINDYELLKPLAIKNKTPKLGILVAVTQCQFHRTNSLDWDKIWAQSIAVDKNKFPTLGQILSEQTAKRQTLATKIKGKIIEAVIKRDYKKNLY